MKNVPFTKENIQNWSQKYPTPFYVYDEAGIRKNAENLKKMNLAISNKEWLKFVQEKPYLDD